MKKLNNSNWQGIQLCFLNITLTWDIQTDIHCVHFFYPETF